MMTVQPRFASTVMLLRDALTHGGGIEVFMVRRVVQSEFMPDVYVFPGGSVISDDRLLEENASLRMTVASSVADPEGRTALGKGLRVAAIRELFEEANVLLAYRDKRILALDEDTVTRFETYRLVLNERRGLLSTIVQTEQLVLATDALTYFAHWITPEGMPKRFDTHFFLAVAPTEQEALSDQLETSEGFWFQPAEVIERFQRREMPVAFPTLHQLRDLSAFKSVQDALEAANTRYISTHVPALIEKEGNPHVYLPEDPNNTWML
jgi:8-oxo-dGTP pyrophosphatase MutT (NUDIX family)